MRASHRSSVYSCAKKLTDCSRVASSRAALTNATTSPPAQKARPSDLSRTMLQSSDRSHASSLGCISSIMARLSALSALGRLSLSERRPYELEATTTSSLGPALAEDGEAADEDAAVALAAALPDT